MASSLSRFVRRLGVLARRDARIAELEAANAALTAELDARTGQIRDKLVRRSSFQARVHAERRLRRLALESGAPSTSVIQHGKLHVYDLARSHGVEPPTEFGRWDDPADIPWRDLPDLVVVKSAFSSAGRGVFPLRRTADGWQVVTHTDTVTDAQLVETLTELVAEKLAEPPFVAEEFLDQDGTGTRMPTDVKAYAFYGEVPLVVLRQPIRHGHTDAATPFRVIGPDGEDVTEFRTRSPIDTSIPVPEALGEIVDAASRLSVAIRAPFSRLDFYSLGDRVVFGEVTPRPGGNNWFGNVIDQRLGDAWDRAQIRLARDLAGGMSPEPVFGPLGRGEQP